MPKPTDLCAFGIGNNMEVVQAPRKYSNKFGISFDLTKNLTLSSANKLALPSLIRFFALPLQPI